MRRRGDGDLGRYPDALRERLRGLWGAGETKEEICAELAIGWKTLDRLAGAMGLPERHHRFERHPEATLERMRQLWDLGRSCKEIGAALGLSDKAVSGLRDRMDLPKRRSRRPQHDAATRERIRQLIADGGTDRQVAVTLGMTLGQISGLRKRLGVHKPPKWQPARGPKRAPVPSRRRPRRALFPFPAERRPPTVAPEPPPLPAGSQTLATRAGLTRDRDAGCGYVSGPPWLYCGLPTVGRDALCPAHRRACHAQPVAA